MQAVDERKNFDSPRTLTPLSTAALSKEEKSSKLTYAHKRPDMFCSMLIINYPLDENIKEHRLFQDNKAMQRISTTKQILLSNEYPSYQSNTILNLAWLLEFHEDISDMISYTDTTISKFGQLKSDMKLSSSLFAMCKTPKHFSCIYRLFTDSPDLNPFAEYWLVAYCQILQKGEYPKFLEELANLLSSTSFLKKFPFIVKLRHESTGYEVLMANLLRLWRGLDEDEESDLLVPETEATIKLLREHDCFNINHRFSTSQSTFLMQVAKRGDSTSLSLALENGARIELEDKSSGQNVFDVMLELEDEPLRRNCLHSLFNHLKGANLADTKGQPWISKVSHCTSLTIQTYKEMLCDDVINAPDHKDDTPLIIAARYGEVERVMLLLERGADVTHTNKDGETALSACQKAADWEATAPTTEREAIFIKIVELLNAAQRNSKRTSHSTASALAAQGAFSTGPAVPPPHKKQRITESAPRSTGK